jgi:cholesterol oxidase
MPVNQFDAVIVGSGFGGAVMAHRLSQAGMRVCVLERGKAWPPGSFPRSPRALGRNWWDPSRGLYGMFQAWSFANLEAIVASGLGGGSLIYANVLLRKDRHWFREQEEDGSCREWPVTREELDPHYDRVEKFLNAQSYPLEHAPYSHTPKTIAFRNAAEKLKSQGVRLDWFLPPLAVTFANRDEDGKLKTPVPGVTMTDATGNLHQSERFTCRLCGECDVGCNYGSKNTLDFNYLSAAWRAKADIRTLCEVKRFRPNDQGRGYTIEYARHDESHAGRGQRQIDTITADRLILAAGTLGTTYLLLKNRDAFPNMSPRLGDRFCTNGDLLSFASRVSTDSATMPIPNEIDPSRGPVITSTIRVGDALDGDGNAGRGFYLQDAGYPEFVNWVIETANAPGVVERMLRFAGRRIRQWWTADPQTEVSAQLARLLGKAENSSGSMPLLGMGRDIPEGKMSLRSNRKGDQFLQVNWANVRSSDYFKSLTALSRKVAETMGAKHIENPITRCLGRLVTVHPLGGCSMGHSPDDGVVDSRGRVFNYPGMTIADGSVMPGPVGANPSLTIAALADLFADEIVNEFNTERGVPFAPERAAAAGARDKPASDISELRTMASAQFAPAAVFNKSSSA